MSLILYKIIRPKICKATISDKLTVLDLPTLNRVNLCAQLTLQTFLQFTEVANYEWLVDEKFIIVVDHIPMNHLSCQSVWLQSHIYCEICCVLTLVSIIDFSSVAITPLFPWLTCTIDQQCPADDIGEKIILMQHSPTLQLPNKHFTLPIMPVKYCWYSSTLSLSLSLSLHIFQHLIVGIAHILLCNIVKG